MESESCSSCGAVIDSSEAAYVWHDAPVCASCHIRLISPLHPSDKPPQPRSRARPIAAAVVPAEQQPAPPAQITASSPDTCANCNRVIGGLEQPFIWQEYVVCRQCYKSLEAGSRAHPVPRGQPGQANSTGSGLWVWALIAGVAIITALPLAIVYHHESEAKQYRDWHQRKMELEEYGSAMTNEQLAEYHEVLDRLAKYRLDHP